MAGKQPNDDILQIQRFQEVNPKKPQPIVHERLPSNNFRFALVGPSKSGKSSIIISFLLHNFRGHFSKVYIACPTYNIDQTYNCIRDKIPEDQVCTKEEDVEQFFNNILESQADSDITHEGEQALVIFDDWSKDTAKFGFLDNISKSRHYNISVLISVQKLVWTSRGVRNNLSHLAIFDCGSRDELKAISDQYSYILTPKVFNLMLKSVCKNKGDFLYINLEGDCKTRFCRNFDDPIEVS